MTATSVRNLQLRSIVYQGLLLGAQGLEPWTRWLKVSFFPCYLSALSPNRSRSAPLQSNGLQPKNKPRQMSASVPVCVLLSHDRWRKYSFFMSPA